MVLAMPEPRPQATDRRSELADFLRGRRARLDPRSTGFAPGRRRRTPGLRREELAHLAGLSVDWYARLEQGRDVNPSRETLDAIARVLRLDDDERGHLFFLARPEVAPRTNARQERPDPAMARAVEAMRSPALVISPRYDVLAWNPAAARLLVPFDGLPPRERNLLWLTFCHPPLRARYVDVSVIEREAAAGFRAGATAFVGDPDVDALVGALLEASEGFRAIWARHEVRAKVGGTKVFRAGEGRLVLDWYALASTTGSKQQLVYYVDHPGAAEGALALDAWLATPLIYLARRPAPAIAPGAPPGIAEASSRRRGRLAVGAELVYLGAATTAPRPVRPGRLTPPAGPAPCPSPHRPPHRQARPRPRSLRCYHRRRPAGPAPCSSRPACSSASRRCSPASRRWGA